MKLRIAKKILRREHRATKAKGNPFFPLFGLGPYSMEQVRRAKAVVDRRFGRPKVSLDPLPPALPGSVRQINVGQLVQNMRVLGKNVGRFRVTLQLMRGTPVLIGGLPAGAYEAALPKLQLMEKR